MKKDSFVFYKSFYEAIKNIPKEEQLILYNAICEYSFTDEIPIIPDGIAKALFILMKPNIDSANARYKASVENGKKGGAPKGNQNARKQPKTTQKQPRNNLNDNDNDNVNDNNNNNNNIINNSNTKTIREIIKYMNKCGELENFKIKKTFSYRHNASGNIKIINARIKEGYTLDDFKDVIYYSYSKFIENEYKGLNGKGSSQYYNPSTIFTSAKMEKYINEYKNIGD